MVIWKYKLEIVDLQAINMPVGASVLSVHRSVQVAVVFDLQVRASSNFVLDPR